MRGLIFLLVLELSSLGTVVSSGLTPPLPVPSLDEKARRDFTENQDEPSCRVSFEGEKVRIYVSCSLTFKPKAFTVYFQNVSSGKNEKVLECDYTNSSYSCLSAKGYTFVEKTNALDVRVNYTITCSDGRFLITINEEKPNFCLRGKEGHGSSGGDWSAGLIPESSDDDWCPPKEPSKDENGGKGLAIGLGLGIAAVAVTVAVVAALFLNRNRSRKSRNLQMKKRKDCSHWFSLGVCYRQTYEQ